MGAQKLPELYICGDFEMECRFLRVGNAKKPQSFD
jgi:hypothetical protein